MDRTIRGGGPSWAEAWVSVDDVVLDPAESLAIRNHSPSGFAWGYGGSGPAQTALAILLHCLGRRNATESWPGGDAERLYQDFKWVLIAKLRDDDGPLDSFEVVFDVEEWAAYQYERLEATAY